MNKGIKSVLVILFGILVTFCTMPTFTIHAASVSGNAPILGVNIYLINTEYERYNTTSSSPLTVDLNGDTMAYWTCIEYSNTGACKTYKSANNTGSTTPASGGQSGTITIPANLFTDNSTYNVSFYEYEFVFDDSYVGNIKFANSFAQGGYDRYFVNGSTLSIYSSTLTTSFEIVEYSLERNYHENWYFPIESFNIITSAFDNGLEQVGLTKMSDYLFPIFNIKTNDVLHSVYAGTSYTFVWKFISNQQINNLSQVTNYFSFSRGEPTAFLNQNTFYWNGQTARLYTVTISNFATAGRCDISYIGSNDRYYMPIYFNTPTWKNISTDFALQFGLSNDLLDNIQIIANGTQASQNSSSSAYSSNNQLSSDSSALMGIEDSYNQDLNTNLQNIDFTNPMTSNPNFLSSAGFVISIFNSLTQNNPLTVFIIIICVVLVGKRIFGK